MSWVLHKNCVKKHNELDAVVEMLIRKILTQRDDKIGHSKLWRTVILADCPHGTNYWLYRYFLPSRWFVPISARYLLSQAFAVKCFFMSLTAAEVNDSKARLRRATASTAQRTYEVYSIVGSVSARRFDRALQLIRQISLRRDFV